LTVDKVHAIVWAQSIREEGAVSTVKSADRTMNVLTFLSSRARPVPTMAIAGHCGLPKSSTYHLLSTMQRQRFVRYYPDRHAWGLGEAAFEIGSGYRRSESIAWLARRTVRDLARETGAVAHLGVLDGSDVVYVLKELPDGRQDRTVTKVGMRMPAHLTAVGRAILMALPPARLRALFPLGQTLAVRTGRGPKLVGELERELAAQRAAGFALERGLTAHGVTCIGATVESHEGAPVAGVGVSIVGECPDVPALAAQVRRAAAHISGTLGHHEEEPALTG
jgi:DNA-binding IclR family transcriptional regulator